MLLLLSFHFALYKITEEKRKDWLLSHTFHFWSFCVMGTLAEEPARKLLLILKCRNE